MAKVSVSQVFNRVPGQVYLWLAIIIFAASSSVTRRLTDIGAENFVNGRNPISFCNVLFVGNICAALVLILIYWRQLNLNTLRRLSRKDWLSMIVVAILSGAIAPGTTFEALARTSVTNVIFIGRIEPPLILALSIWLLKEPVNVWEIAGALTAFAGVVVTGVLQSLWNPGQDLGSFGSGEILAAIGAVSLAVANIVSKTRLTQIPLGIFTIFRTVLGAAIFFWIALYLFGSNHFIDVFSPFLWKWMLVYGAVIVAVGQLSWFAGLRSTKASAASLASAFNPIVAILAAYLILGEAPTLAHYVGGGVILIGIGLGQIGIWRQRSPKMVRRMTEEAGIGFRGV